MRPTKTGGEYKQFTMEDGKKLSVFSYDPRYAELEVGSDIPETDLIFDPAYGNYKLNKAPVVFPARPASLGGPRPSMAAAVEKKGVMIEKAQERKSEGVNISGAFRDATLISLASLRDQPFPTDEEFKAEWRKWVKFIMNEHEQPFW